MDALICYNPKSGRQNICNDILYIKKRLKEKYDEVDVYKSLEPESITKYIKNFGQLYSLIVVCGGDGTLNEAINGLMNISIRPKLAYIPAGTVNDVGTMLNLKKDLKKNIDLILNDVSAKIDVCKINDKFFIYACGIGTFTDISYETSPKLKKRFGKLAYFIEAISRLTQDDELNLEVKTDDEAFNSKYYVVLLLNSKRIAGFHLHRKVKPKLDDGIIDVSFLSKAKFKFSFFRLAFFFLFGDRIKHGIKTIRTSKIEIKSNKKIKYNVDGEFGLASDIVSVSVINKAIDIIVSEKIKKKYFINQ